MSVYKKIQEARNHIKSMKVDKAGYNSYGKYYYFTPEQISKLVHDAEKELDLFHRFDLLIDDFGYYGRVWIVDLKDNSEIEFIQRTAIPAITATNASQQIGGAVTFTQRYMLMTIYDIADNSLDFDGDSNSPAKPQKKQTTQAKKKVADKPKEKTKNEQDEYNLRLKQAIIQAGNSTNIKDLTDCWKYYKELHDEDMFIDAVKDKRKELEPEKVGK